jgi:hypothetical protein
VVRRLLPAFTAVMICSACAVPIFDPSMSLAARTLDRIPVTWQTPTLTPPVDGGKSRFNLGEDTLGFWPERVAGSFDLSRGFVFRTYPWDDKTEAWYEWNDAGTIKWMNGPWQYNPEETFPSRLPVWLKNGPYLGVIEFDSEPWADRLWADIGFPQFTYNPPQHSFFLPDDINMDVVPSIGGTPHIVGMSANALSTPAQDRVAALVRRDGLYREVWTDLSAGGIGMWNSTWAVPNYPLNVIFGDPWRLNYFRDFDKNRGFAQSYDGRGWTTWVWWSAVPDYAKLTRITHRIDAVLSPAAGLGASYLFSTEGGIGRVYRYDGTGSGELVALFGLGTLRFIGEAYVFGSWQVLFSRCVVDDPGSDSTPGSFHFEIRAIATTDLVSTFGL